MTVSNTYIFLFNIPIYSSEGLPSLMQDSWPPPEGEHLEESTAEEIDIPVYDAASIDLPIGAGCSAVVCNVLPNTPSTETV